MGLKEEAFYVIIWALVALALVVLFDPTGRIAKPLILFRVLAALTAGLTWGIIAALG
jgi:hypothetical protein